ncbi:MAG TPA: nickel-dependent lactate racemase [Acidobacteriota bacterium]|nr:nickel-dependent lactate racemase [Acidobacteriota bacterium]
MKVKLAYGREGLDVDLPDGRTTVIEPMYSVGLADERAALTEAIQNPRAGAPLSSLVKQGDTVAISVCDVTRPIPTSRILPVLLKELTRLSPESITILVATGTHRPTSGKELASILGTEVLFGFRVINHECHREDALSYLGDTASGIPIWLNREWVESDVRITVGFVEPHFFAGYSGGPKMVAPGLAGLETILGLHSAALIADPNSTWGMTTGNPIHDAIREIATGVGVTFSLDVAINRERQITGVYAGDQATAHGQACEFVAKTAMREVPGRFEVVVTTNSGYPLDLNLYQAVKGMSAAARVVKSGGTIICAAECSDGIPDHGEYKKLLTSADGPKELLDKIGSPGFSCQDQWQVQVQAQIQLMAHVYLKSTSLSSDQVRAAHLEPVASIEKKVEDVLEQWGPEAKVCVLPEGPQTIPYVERKQ